MNYIGMDIHKRFTLAIAKEIYLSLKQKFIRQGFLINI